MPRLRLVLIAVGGSCDLARERDGRGLRNDRRYRVCHRRVAERRFDGPLLKVRNTAILPVSGARAGRSGIVKGFRTAARHRREGVHGGRRPSLEGENRGGSSQRRWCRSMWNLPPLLDLICGFGTGRRLSDEPCAGFGRPGWDRHGDRVFGAPGFVGRRWRRGSLSAKRGRCR